MRRALCTPLLGLAGVLLAGRALAQVPAPVPPPAAPPSAPTPVFPSKDRFGRGSFTVSFTGKGTPVRHPLRRRRPKQVVIEELGIPGRQVLPVRHPPEAVPLPRIGQQVRGLLVVPQRLVEVEPFLERPGRAAVPCMIRVRSPSGPGYRRDTRTRCRRSPHSGADKRAAVGNRASPLAV